VDPHGERAHTAAGSARCRSRARGERVRKAARAAAGTARLAGRSALILTGLEDRFPGRQSHPLTRPVLKVTFDGAAPMIMQNATHLSASGRATTVTIFVPGLLRHCCDGASELTMPATSVRAAFEQLERCYPSLYRSVCDETGAVRRHVNIFVNAFNTRDGNGLDTALLAGDVVTILPAVSGG
jgi:molybdopterin synthase sulfur carrier subunit